MNIIITIIKAAFMAYLVIFAVINMQDVQLTLFFKATPFTMPMFLFVILVLFIGFLAGVLLKVGEKYKANRNVKRMQKELKQAETEINRLKNIPLNNSKEENLLDNNEVKAENSLQENEAIKDALR